MVSTRICLTLFAALALAACGGREASLTSKETAGASSPGQSKAQSAAQSAGEEAAAMSQEAQAAAPADEDTATSLPPTGTPADLTNPGDPAFNQTAPDTFRARFSTSKGDIVIEVHREWAPRGADRFYSLVSGGYYDDVRFFRVIAGFMAQFGMHGDPAVNTAWADARIPDDPVLQSNERGMISFATAGPNTRTTQLFINFGNNANLDGMGFAPFGQVVTGMDVVDSLYAGYGEGAPRGLGPNQNLIRSRGNEYLDEKFPQLDKVVTARIE